MMSTQPTNTFLKITRPSQSKYHILICLRYYGSFFNQWPVLYKFYYKVIYDRIDSAQYYKSTITIERYDYCNLRSKKRSLRS
jgi:hypothetical protein